MSLSKQFVPTFATAGALELALSAAPARVAVAVDPVRGSPQRFRDVLKRDVAKMAQGGQRRPYQSKVEE